MRVSTSGKKKDAQKHKNVYSFQPNKNSNKKTQIINSLPISGVCQRCKDILEWRKKFNKYKPLTIPKRCVSCEEKTIKEAYRILCDKCANKKGVCSKCQQSTQIIISDVKSDKELLKEQQERDRLLSTLSERKKRTYIRKLEREEEPSLNNLIRSSNDIDLLIY
ncbi:7799_t:CDS:2 [Diversispora eburnea]|uniref:7799_t:CDS:1 n=1 Tax=Diversispora eburnea TaxID=1213867 RepID=A0A9N8YMV4_9GLOM|nr:7799_t:CDS:2 [Diversispora eburnea]